MSENEFEDRLQDEEHVQGSWAEDNSEESVLKENEVVTEDIQTDGTSTENSEEAINHPEDTQDSSLVEIEEEEVPLGDAETILKEALGDEEEIGEEYVEIVEADVPLTNVPEKEASSSTGWMIAGFSLLFLLIALVVGRIVYKKVADKKNEEEE